MIKTVDAGTQASVQTEDLKIMDIIEIFKIFGEQLKKIISFLKVLSGLFNP